jgi:hypothetical protein
MGAISSISQWYHTDGSLTGDQVAEVFIRFLADGIRQRATNPVLI